MTQEQAIAIFKELIEHGYSSVIACGITEQYSPRESYSVGVTRVGSFNQDELNKLVEIAGRYDCEIQLNLSGQGQVRFIHRPTRSV